MSSQRPLIPSTSDDIKSRMPAMKLSEIHSEVFTAVAGIDEQTTLSFKSVPEIAVSFGFVNNPDMAERADELMRTYGKSVETLVDLQKTYGVVLVREPNGIVLRQEQADVRETAGKAEQRNYAEDIVGAISRTAEKLKNIIGEREARLIGLAYNGFEVEERADEVIVRDHRPSGEKEHRFSREPSSLLSRETGWILNKYEASFLQTRNEPTLPADPIDTPPDKPRASQSAAFRPKITNRARAYLARSQNGLSDRTEADMEPSIPLPLEKMSRPVNERPERPGLALLARLAPEGIAIPTQPEADAYDKTFGGLATSHMARLSLTHEGFADRLRRVIMREQQVTADTVAKWQDGHDYPRWPEERAALVNILIYDNDSIQGRLKDQKHREFESALQDTAWGLEGRAPRTRALGRLITKYRQDVGISELDLASRVVEQAYVLPTENIRQLDASHFAQILADKRVPSPGLAAAIITTLNESGRDGPRRPALDKQEIEALTKAYHTSTLRFAPPVPTVVEALASKEEISPLIESALPVQKTRNSVQTEPGPQDSRSRISGLRSELRELFVEPLTGTHPTQTEICDLTLRRLTTQEIGNYLGKPARIAPMTEERTQLARKELSEGLRALGHPPRMVRAFQAKFDELAEVFATRTEALPQAVGTRPLSAGTRALDPGA